MYKVEPDQQIAVGEQPSGNGFNQLPNHDSIQQNKDCLKTLSLPWKITLNIIVFLILTASIICGVIYGPNKTTTSTSSIYLPASVTSGQLSPSLGSILINSIQLQQQQYIGVGYGTNYKKLQMTDPMTTSVLASFLSPIGQIQYVQYISLQKFLAYFNFSQQQTNNIQRLKQYFKNQPENAIQKLIDDAKLKLQYPYSYARDGTKIDDNLKIVKINHTLQVEVYYDISEQKFKPTPQSQMSTNMWQIGFTNSSSEPKSQTNLQSQPSPFSDQQFDNLFLRVMRNPIWEMKRLASRSITFINSQRSQQFIKYQQSMAISVDNSAEWKQTLINDCRTIQSLKFRCTAESAHKIIPQLTIENIIASRDQYWLTNTLQLVFETVKQS